MNDNKPNTLPLLLCVETATEVCSVALSHGDRVLGSMAAEEPYQHARELSPLIEKLLRQAAIAFRDLDAISVSQGPGSYTALRIGVSTTKGMAFALGKKIIAVPTLAALALAARKVHPIDRGHYIPMIDARRKEVYMAIYDENGSEISAPISVDLQSPSFSNALNQDHPVLLCGNGMPKAKAIINSPSIQFVEVYCDAIHLVEPALKAWEQERWADTAYLEPIYLKPPHVTTPKKRI